MLNPAEIRSKMTVPPELKPAYDKIVAAGMRVMFSDKTNSLMMQQLKATPDIVKNIADGIAGLMGILFKNSNNKMPQQLIIPAALDLMMHAVDYIIKTKMAQLTPQQIGAATEATINAVLAKFNISPQQAQQILAQMGQKAQGGTQAGGMAQPAPSQAAPRGGIINGGM